MTEPALINVETYISVQHDDFDMAAEYQRLAASASCGAVVTFSGLVREFAKLSEQDAPKVTELFLEHYPGMTEKALADIVERARSRWPLGPVTVIHRIGALPLNAQIVFVGVASAHRDAAFSAAQFIMDFLKTEAPFWKRETADGKTSWVDARQSDQEASKRWS
ncbi:molybdopterin synthase catalytic subunit MoaE [Corallincola holothuriorum]|uniref:Molybdopterin synthase catalytic subunit n=1 Tax=Corallincola holothuriorum TaxID=2282215 RepID=A0A368NM74_9GAMM|nr:molybdopterin synthase catalytic subunit MoaE [Corallincola holothuriorum]RCU51692.1 molybdopterin synthase catalytic subunit MoaE [Corallincola holothuriorum]